MSQHILVIWLLLNMELAMAAEADVFHCVGDDGVLVFSDKPCPDDRSLSELSPEAVPEQLITHYNGTEGLEQPKEQQHPVIPDLEGRWSDVIEGGAVATYWAFSKDTVVITQPSGRQVNAGYTLKGDILIIHHMPEYLNQWDELLRIIAVDRDRLTWRWGTETGYLYRVVQ